MNEWISKLKNTMNPGIFVMLIVGIALLLMSCGMDEQTEQKTGYSYDDLSEVKKEPSDETELISYYEEKLEKLLAEVEGIGTVRVMLSPDLTGVCILCEGAEEVQVQSDIMGICGSLFEIPAHKVKILKIIKENAYEG